MALELVGHVMDHGARDRGTVQAADNGKRLQRLSHGRFGKEE
jgi:hypothetical protein